MKHLVPLFAISLFFVAAALPATVTAMVSTSNNSAALAGLWTPQHFMNVVVISSSSSSSNACPGSSPILLQNYMQSAGSKWNSACGSFDETSSRLTVVVDNDPSKQFSARLVGTQLLAWDNVTTPLQDHTAPFRGPAVWAIYGSPTTCLLPTPDVGEEMKGNTDKKNGHGKNSKHSNNEWLDAVKNHRMSNAGRAFLEKEKKKMTENAAQGRNLLHYNASDVKKVRVMLMQHFDMGYTDFMACVLSSYITFILPGAAIAVLEASQLPATDSYVYTTHPALLIFFFRCEEFASRMKPPPGLTAFACPVPATLSLVESAIRSMSSSSPPRSYMTWHHGSPFDYFPELVGAELFSRGFDYADWLDRRFGRTPPFAKTASQIDVPGRYGVQVPIMARRGIKATYQGSNSFPYFAGAAKTLPDLFRWRGSENATSHEILFYNHYRGYGGLQYADAIYDPGSATAFFATVTLENQPPFTPVDLSGILAHIRSMFPNAAVTCSTLEDFTADILAVSANRTDLPLVTADIGNSWIRAAPSDPVKLARLQQARAVFDDCVSSGGCPRDDNKSSVYALLVMSAAEHNFGLPAQSASNYTIFGYQTAAYSYQEKRDLLANLPQLPTSRNFQEKQKQKKMLRRRREKQQRMHLLQGLRRSSSSSPATSYSTGKNNCIVIPELLHIDGKEVSANISMCVDPKSGAVNKLDVLDSSRGQKVLKSLANSNHTLFEMHYLVTVTGTNWQSRPSPWGSPLMPFSKYGLAHNMLAVTDIVPQPRGFLISARLNLTYYNNNTKKPDDERFADVTFFLSLAPTSGVASSSSAKSSELGLLGLQLFGHFVVDSLTPSWQSGMYAAFQSAEDISSALYLRMDPAVAHSSNGNGNGGGGWSITTLGSAYSPYNFHYGLPNDDFSAAGICQYHIADEARYMVAGHGSSGNNSNNSEQVSVVIASEQAKFLQFGLFNATFNSRGPPTERNGALFCTPEESSGVYYNLHNNFNANWILGPWKREQLEFDFVVLF